MAIAAMPFSQDLDFKLAFDFQCDLIGIFAACVAQAGSSSMNDSLRTAVISVAHMWKGPVLRFRGRTLMRWVMIRGLGGDAYLNFDHTVLPLSCGHENIIWSSPQELMS